MKWNVVVLMSTLGLLSGCGITPTKTQSNVTKSFFNRTIIYEVSPKANDLMIKLESLIAQAQELDPPIPDKIILPLYRDADIDRNHTITPEEAQTFYQSFVLKFEDALGAISFTRTDRNDSSSQQ